MNYTDLTYLLDEKTLNFRGMQGCLFETLWDFDSSTTDTKFCVHRLHMNAGIGTHIDSPLHCFKNGVAVCDIIKQPEFKGYIFDFEKSIIDVNFTINAQMLIEKIKQMSIKSLKNCFIVIKNGWGIHWGTEKYYKNYICPHISECAVKFLLDEKVAGVGTDTYTLDSLTGNWKCVAHEILLSNNIWLVENVANLQNFSDSKGTFIVSPLRIISSESPIRLFFRKE